MKYLSTRALAGGRAMRQHRGAPLCIAVPSQEIEAAKREQHRSDATQ